MTAPYARPIRGRRLAAATVGTLGYLVFTIVGLVGVSDSDLFGARVTWAPNVGLVLTIAGTITAAVTGLRQLLSGRTTPAVR